MANCASVSRPAGTLSFPSNLAPQAWAANAYPLLCAHLAESVDSVLAYQLLYQEAALANLLEARHHIPCKFLPARLITH